MSDKTLLFFFLLKKKYESLKNFLFSLKNIIGLLKENAAFIAAPWKPRDIIKSD